MTTMNESRLIEILLRIRGGAISQTDATDDEVQFCIDQGLAERELRNGIVMTVAVDVSGDTLLDFDSTPKLHGVRLTAKGHNRLRTL